MELIVRLEGPAEEEPRLKVERDGTCFRVQVGDRSYEVDRIEPGGPVRSLVINGRQHDVAVSHRGGGHYEIASSKGVDRVQVLDRLTHLAEQAHQRAATSEGNQTNAYMPGRVVELLVEEGSAVAAGQGVLVLEAMKMENELLAERAGVVRKFFVVAGQAVEGGDPLYEID